jgi:hypothetical protein
MVAGVYFLTKYRLKRLNSQRNNSNPGRLAEIEQLKRTGDQISVTLDNAEVMTRSYQQEIVQDGIPSCTEIADGLFDSNRNYRSQEICQTYIVIYKQCTGKTFKYISPSISQDAETLKLYLERQKGIDLYIDPKNPEKGTASRNIPSQTSRIWPSSSKPMMRSSKENRS